MRHTHVLKKIGAYLLGAAAIAAIAVFASNALIITSTHAYRYASLRTVPAKPVALVFGAGVNTNKTPTRALADRIDAGMALYHAGKVRKLIFTGDDGTVRADEVDVMLRYALDQGLDPHAVTSDGAGFDTYDSCYRAKHVFGVNAAVLVTQSYHLARAVFLCRSMGIDVVGLAVPDWGVYNPRMMRLATFRETFARVKAVWEGMVTHPIPRVT